MTATLTPQERLRQDIGLLLDELPMISGRQAHLRLNPGIRYDSFMDHFNAVVELRGLEPRKPGRPRKVPLPAIAPRVPVPTRMESGLGHYQGTEGTDGRFTIELRFQGTVSRAVHLFLLGAFRSLFFPEIDS